MKPFVSWARSLLNARDTTLAESKFLCLCSQGSPLLCPAARSCRTPEFAALKGALTLSIVEAERSTSGGSADFSFKLTNRGVRVRRRVWGHRAVCPTRSRHRVASAAHFVDHPGLYV